MNNYRYSVFLDLIRFLAALSVAFYHFSDNFSGESFSFIARSNLGHNAVIVFFVLSGYVIFSSVRFGSDDFSRYLVKRIVRLHSVVIPALFLIIFIDSIGSWLSPEIYKDRMDSNYLLLKFFINLFFSQELHFYSFRFMTNGPLWSLSYEFWYYVIFGVLFFVKDNKVKFLYVALLFSLIGFKILLLFPIWLLGVFVLKLNHSISFDSRVSFLFFLFFFFVMTFLTFSDLSVFMISDLENFGNDLFLNFNLSWSKYFLFDYIFSIFFSLFLFFSFYAIDFSFFRFFDVKCFSDIVKMLSASTLTIYVLHYPIMIFIYALLSVFSLNYGVNMVLDVFVFFTTICICFFLSLFCENKSSFFYRKIFSLFSFLFGLIRLSR